MKKIALQILICSLCFFLFSASLRAQDKTIQGHVTDQKGQGIPGVNVVYKGTLTGTITDVSGNFTLPFKPDGNDVLQLSFIGFKTKEVNIGNQSSLNILLEEEYQLLQEVVAVGYGIQKKADLTGSVSSVKTDELTRTPVAGVDQALQGVASGVTVSQTTGAPGEGVSVRIRGVGSINSSNSPLYIVDGIPTEDAINTLSTSDIESISILKDAASAAIYGSRANNGVVLITTKKGKAGKTKFDFNMLTGIQTHGHLTTMASTQQYVELYNEAAENDNEDVTSKALMRELISDSLAATLPDVDQLGEIFRHAVIQNYNLSASGGKEKLQYLISGNYYDQEGILLNSDYKRYSGKVSLNSQAEDWLKIGTNLNFSKVSTNIVGSSGDGYGGNGGSAVRYALFRSTAIPIYDEDGNFSDLPGNQQFFGDGYNPVGVLKNTYNLKDIYRFFGDVSASVQITENLSFISRFGVDHYSYNQRRFNKTWGTDDRINNPNSLTVSDGQYNSWTWNSVFNYSPDLNSNHHLKFALGSEAVKEKIYDNSVTEKDFPDQDLNVVYLGNGEGSISTGESRNTGDLLSFFGRVNYDYQGKYLASATIREDGSSRFAKGNKWGTFFSGSLGWRIDQENFLKSVKFINQWKLRAGAGFIGNQNIGYYAYSDKIASGYNYSFGGVSQKGYAMSAFGNKDVKWETSNQYDVGMDLVLFRGKINFTLDYYRKITKNMLTKESLPTSAGYADPAWVNRGKVLNTGFEAEAGYAKKIGDFKYNITANFSTLKNEVKELANPITGGRIDNGVYATKTEEGHPIGSFYLYEMEGIFQNKRDIITHAHQGDIDVIKPGDVKYKDQNNDGVIDANDRVHVGSAIPDFTMGLNLGAEYRNFDCSAFFQGAFGQDVYYQVATDIEGFYRAFNVTERYYNEHWTGEGTSNSQPRASWDAKSNNVKPSTRFLEDGSYIRLKALEVGYTLPPTIARKASLEKCRIYFSSMNLWTWTKYPGLDPEMTTSNNSEGEGDRAAGLDWGTYPSAVSFNVGLQLTF
jgi:TonB-dependent starch-binding outer membrane protein SusC